MFSRWVGAAATCLVLVGCTDESATDGDNSITCFDAGSSEKNPSAADESLRYLAANGGFRYALGTDYSAYLSDMTSSVHLLEKRNDSGNPVWGVVPNPTADAFAGDYGAIAASGDAVFLVGHRRFPDDDVQLLLESRSTDDGSLNWEALGPATRLETTGVAATADAVFVAYSQRADDGAGGFEVVWFIERRSRTDGSVEWSTKSDPSPNFDVPVAVAVHDGGVYVAGTANLNSGTPTVSFLRLERYDAATGTLDWGVDSDPGDLDDRARGLAIDASGVYLTGYETKVTAKSAALRVQKHALADGALVWAEERLGVFPEGIAVGAGKLVTVGREHDIPDNYGSKHAWVIEVRDPDTGARLWSGNRELLDRSESATSVVHDGGAFYVGGYARGLGGTSTNDGWLLVKHLCDG